MFMVSVCFVEQFMVSVCLVELCTMSVCLVELCTMSVCLVELCTMSVCLVGQSENRTCERSKHKKFCWCLFLPLFNVFSHLSVV